MKIVIAGGGRVGTALAARLVAQRHAVTVIDRDRGVVDRVFEEVGAVTVHGDATDPRILEAAGLATADVVAAMLQRDADNLAVTVLARARTDARIMVRMLDDTYRDAYHLAGARDVIAEADVVVTKIATSLEFPEVGGIIPLAGDAIVFELPITPRSRVAGKTVAQVRAEPSFPRDCVFAAIVDAEGRTELPTGVTALRAGHTLVLVARREQLGDAVAALTAEPPADRSSVAGLTAVLQGIDFLAPLRDTELAELARGLTFVRKREGELLFAKGESGDAFYLLLAGEVALRDEAGHVLEVVKPGGFFGEIALLTGEPRSTSAVAAAPDCEMVAIGRDDFRRVVMGNPSLALEMSRILGQRLADAAKARPAPRRGLFRRSS
jgi:trk system potassium uptake protein TrkA